MNELNITLTGPVAIAWRATMKLRGISDHSEMALYLMGVEQHDAMDFTPTEGLGHKAGDPIPLVFERGGVRVDAQGEPSGTYRVKMINGPAKKNLNVWLPSTNAATLIARAQGEEIATNIGSGFVLWRVRDGDKPYSQLETFEDFLARHSLRKRPSRRRA